MKYYRRKKPRLTERRWENVEYLSPYALCEVLRSPPERCVNVARDRAFISTMYMGCTRCSESLNLLKRDIMPDMEEGKQIIRLNIKVLKKRKFDKEGNPLDPVYREAIINMEDPYEGQLGNYILKWIEGLEPNNHIFNFKRRTAWNITSLWLQNYKGKYPHSLRYRGCTYLRKLGFDLDQLQDMMEWANIEEAQVYSKFSTKDLLKKRLQVK